MPSDLRFCMVLSRCGPIIGMVFYDAKRRGSMKIVKNVVAAFAAAALAGSMVCVAPAVAMEKSHPASASTGSVYVAKAKAKKVSLKAGFSTMLKVKGKKVTKWATSKKSVVTVSKKGKANAKKAGKATVTAYYRGGKAVFNVTVTDPAAKEREKLTREVLANGVDDGWGRYVYQLTRDDSCVVRYEADEDMNREILDFIYTFPVAPPTNDDEEEIPAPYFLISMKKGSTKAELTMVKYSDLDDVTYRATVNMSTCNIAKVKWRGYIMDEFDEYYDLQDYVLADAREMGQQAYDEFNAQLKERTGQQFADLGFYSMPRI